MVSPSGMDCAPEIQSLRRHMKTSILQKSSEEVLPGRLSVDGGDKHAAPVILTSFHILLVRPSEKSAQIARRRRSLRFLDGQKCLQVGIIAAHVRNQLPIA